MVVLGGDGNTAYAANLGNATTTVIDLGAGKVVTTLATGDGTEGIDVSSDGKEIWVSASSGSVAIFDAGSNEIVVKLQAECLPIRLKLKHDGKSALVARIEDAEFCVFNVA